jgi:hypothetical protein
MEALGPEMGPKGGKEKRKRKKEKSIIIIYIYIYIYGVSPFKTPSKPALTFL